VTEPIWKSLPSGPELRRIVAERRGWHIRKIWVGSGGVEYDHYVYDNDDRIAYHREIKSGDATEDEAAFTQTWLEAMNDPDCPRWDEDLTEALDLAYGMQREIRQENGTVHAWVKSSTFTAAADTEPMAIVLAWLAATEDDPAYFHP
jgi:hypothetical protein